MTEPAVIGWRLYRVAAIETYTPPPPGETDTAIHVLNAELNLHYEIDQGRTPEPVLLDPDTGIPVPMQRDLGPLHVFDGEIPAPVQAYLHDGPGAIGWVEIHGNEGSLFRLSVAPWMLPLTAHFTRLFGVEVVAFDALPEA